jgi:hypothetical protein
MGREQRCTGGKAKSDVRWIGEGVRGEGGTILVYHGIRDKGNWIPAAHKPKMMNVNAKQRWCGKMDGIWARPVEREGHARYRSELGGEQRWKKHGYMLVTYV